MREYYPQKELPWEVKMFPQDKSIDEEAEEARRQEAFEVAGRGGEPRSRQWVNQCDLMALKGDTIALRHLKVILAKDPAECLAGCEPSGPGWNLLHKAVAYNCRHCAKLLLKVFTAGS